MDTYTEEQTLAAVGYDHMKVVGMFSINQMSIRCHYKSI